MFAFGPGRRRITSMIRKHNEKTETSKYGSAGREGKLLSAPKTYKQPKMAKNRLDIRGYVGDKINTLG